LKIFVAGATGVLGRRAVAKLAEAGHEVTGVARTPEKAELLQRLGVQPVAVDLFDAGAVKGAVSGSEVVANLATHIPNLSRAALPGAWSENDRIRGEASRNLVDGALATGASRYIQESIAFLYGDGGDAWLDEETPLDVPALGRSVLDAEAQAQRFTDGGGTGVVLRFGQFYAPEAAHSIAMAKMIKRRVAPALGDPTGYVTSIHAEDAAGAVVAALDAPAGTYNVTEDEPVTRAELARVLADAFGKKVPRMLPKVVAKAGGAKTNYLARSHRVSNRRFKEATGWAPAYPSVRDGWPGVAAAMTDD
jgi:2-alkyl-3-oxoalkanoate reductase